MEVRAAGESIRSGEKLAQDMDDFEVKISEVEQSLCLMTVEVLYLMEVHQVLVICKDLDGKREAVEIVPPGFQSTDDGKEFLVVGIIVPFSRNK